MPGISPHPEWARTLVKEAKKRAKRKDLEFDIDVPFVLALAAKSGDCCSITGIPFDHSPSETYRRPWAPSLDRIDCTRGYTRDNVRITSIAVNYAMGQFGLDALKRIAEALCSPEPACV